MRSTIRLVLLAALLLGAVPAHASSITVTDAVSGSPGDWFHDFTVTNDISSTLGGMGIILFGVQLPYTDIVGSPTGWHFIPSYVPCCHDVFGGSLTVYNNPWAYDGQAFAVSVGATLSGFRAHDTSLVAQTEIPWFAFANNPFDNNGADTVNSNDGHFYSDTNPGYEGVVVRDVHPVPEPSSCQRQSKTDTDFGQSEIEF